MEAELAAAADPDWLERSVPLSGSTNDTESPRPMRLPPAGFAGEEDEDDDDDDEDEEADEVADAAAASLRGERGEASPGRRDKRGEGF